MGFRQLQIYTSIGALFCAISVGFGALGAHALKAHWEPERLSVLITALQYCFFHGLSLLTLVSIVKSLPKLTLNWLLTGILLGTSLFSGSLILWCFTQWKPFVFITPIGGIILLLSWLGLSYQFWSQLRRINP